MRESRDIIKVDPTKIPIPEKPTTPMEKPVGEKKLTLGDITNNIALAVLKSKAILDSESAKVKREVYEKDEILKNIPLTTFEITDVEVELKFLVGGVEKEDIVINVDSEQLTRAQNAVSSIKFKLTSKKLSEFLIEGKERVIK
ncbi:MAG: hypothetical protein NZ872_02620 [Archaeoglobaceae archaeon]|nr:hypothetical protein [Archaeoglobaceae archaeon]MDW8128091.1 hypothetical protein [Archaeoglobaceae archaeon]